MQNNSLGTYTWSFGISVIVTSIFSALLVVVKESNPDTVMAWMKATGHHWAAHGVLNLIVFLAVGYGLAALNKDKEVTTTASSLTTWLTLAVLAGTVIISGFFFLEG